MEAIPPETIGIRELVELFVEQRYGEAAVAEIENEVDEKIDEVTGKIVTRKVTQKRAGKVIDLFEDIEHWDWARQTICDSIAKGVLAPHVEDSDGNRKRLTKDGWDISLPMVCNTFTSGTLCHTRDSKLFGKTVYFPESETRRLLDSLAKPQKEQRKKRKEGFGRADPEEKIQDAVRKVKKRGIRKSLAKYQPEVYFAIKNEDGVISRSGDYEKQTGMKPSTLDRIVRSIYK